MAGEADREALRRRLLQTAAQFQVSWSVFRAQAARVDFFLAPDAATVLTLPEGVAAPEGHRKITVNEATSARRAAARLVEAGRALGIVIPVGVRRPAASPSLVAARAVARERRAQRAARAERAARAPRPPRTPRRPRKPRPRRRPRRPRAARPPRPPRPPRAPRAPGRPGRQVWCFGLKDCGVIFPPPNWRVYEAGFNPNEAHAPWRESKPWTPATDPGQCDRGLCGGPCGSRFIAALRRWFGRPEAVEGPPPPRRERRRERARLRQAALPPLPVGAPAPQAPPPPRASGFHSYFWEFAGALFPPPNRRVFAVGFDPNTIPGQAGKWRLLGGWDGERFHLP